MPEAHGQNEIDITLDIEWGGGGPTNWNGNLTLSEGKVINAWNTLLEGNECFSVVSGKKIVWRSKTNGPTDGIRVKCSIPMEASILFRTAHGTTTFPVKDIIDSTQRRQVGRNGQYISIFRYMRDFFYIVKDRPNYIFDPGEKWTFEWRLDLKKRTNIQDATYEVSVVDDKTKTLVNAFPRKPLQINYKTKFVAEQTVQMPWAEGVYSIYIKINTNEGLPLPDLRSQVIVIDPVASKITPSGSKNKLKIVDRILTANTYKRDRFRHDGTSRVIKNKNVAYRISGEKAVPCSLKTGGSCTMNWFGYKLKIENVGKPHLLKVKYPRDKTRRFVISIIEASPNPRGKADYQIDQGIVVDRSAEGDALAMGAKDIIFWPTTNNPTVAIVNTLDGSEAAVESLDLLEMTSGLAHRSPPRDKLVGPYLEDPFFPKFLGGRTISDPRMKVGAGTISDWTTFYDATLHLVEFMHHRGYNAAMIPVLAYGGTLYPSELVENTGRYDNGLSAADARHIQQKDVVQLLLKIFERNGLTLVPTFVFYYPLNRIENNREKMDPADYIYSIHKSGQNALSKLKFQERSKLGPRYNPLNSMVQKEVKAIVKEFVDRYKKNSALGNIGLQLNTTGWIQFPGLNWGYDPKTIQAFLNDSNLPIPSSINFTKIINTLELSTKAPGDNGGNMYPQYLHNIYLKNAFDYLNSDEVRPAWIHWRNVQLKNFYSSIADIIYHNGNKRKLLLSYMNIFSSRYSDDPPHKAISNNTSPCDLLAFKGVNPLLYKNNMQIKLLAPVRTPIPLHEQRIKQASISRMPETISLFSRAGAKGVVEFHDYFETKIKTINENWWWPLNYWMVATFDVKEKPEPKEFYSEYKYFFSGGWQIPQ